ncbi:zinc-dependent alcohol dehydrogenase family protein [Kiloniella laminariae]|uniref:Zinc-dependent alcohol dehydrogenase family protein n=1 Tax=Kiloniella laminariae TaxID=454162 RepID=A0ABT4LGY7_9PROT|nr:zinc-dependent alcohol dehydrogenase family protein [Kiloniella laminariae]MCZ4280370.1 zinc-dependent alcohol dehydrogenase family protein [Kiloniella laminariae]
MRAAFYEKFNGDIRVGDLPDPQVSAGGVVIEVKANGVCRSDWHGWVGHDNAIQTFPHVPGHECSGTIVEVGQNVTRWRKGDEVIVPFSCGCGACPSCQLGNEHICDNDFQPGFTAWGAFAQYLAVDYADVNLVRLPEQLNHVVAASLGCRFMTAFRGVVNRGGVAPEQWVAIHGCGGVGLSAVMIAKAFGARVVAVDINSASLHQARELGADHIVNATEAESVIAAIIEITAGGAGISIDALGSPVTAYNSIACLAKRGRHVQIGLAAGDHKDMKIPMNLVIGRELDIYGSHGMQGHKYGQMLEMVIKGQLQPEKLIDRTVSLEDGAQILMDMSHRSPQGVVVIDRF